MSGIIPAKQKKNAIAMRGRIIQAAASGMNNHQISRALGLSVNTVRLWRRRWIEWQNIPLEEVEVEERLSDAARSGSPELFSAEQITQIIAIACEDPGANGYPVSHRTLKEIVMEAVKHGVVERISERQVGRFLKRGGFETTPESLLAQHNRKRPNRVREQVHEVCDTYGEAPTYHEQGHDTVISVDEMTGIQALERIAPTKSTRPGLVERREFEYKRHGTRTLIANFNVATGEIPAPSLGLTRTEFDFAEPIARTIAFDPEANWTFVSDQLNTHQSETLVKLVAALCGIEDDLGKKGQSGILKSMETRRPVLNDPDTIS